MSAASTLIPNYNQPKSSLKVRGFKFPKQIYDNLDLIFKESTIRVPSSALTVYLTLLSECNERGIVGEYSMKSWSDKLDIPISTLCCGMRYLEGNNYIQDKIIQNRTVIEISHYERFNNPERKEDLNYFRVPHFLFETNILKELVRRSNSKGIMFLLSLFNRFRTAITSNNDINSTLPYNMAHLKTVLNKTAIKVREYAELLRPLFSFDVTEEIKRGYQIVTRRYIVKLKKSFIQQEEDPRITNLLGKMKKELTYILEGFNHRATKDDVDDIIGAFKQESVDVIKYLEPQTKRDDILEKCFLNVMDLLTTRDQQKSKRIDSLGKYSRKLFRKETHALVKSLDRNDVILAIAKEHEITQKQPKIAKLFHTELKS